MSLRSRIIAGMLLLPAISAAVGFSATAAQADSSDCPSGYVCMWEDPNFSGSMYVRQPLNNGSYDIDGWDGDNEISSIYVNGAQWNCVTLYDSDNWTGASLNTAQKGNMLKKLSLYQYDNKAESYTVHDC